VCLYKTVSLCQHGENAGYLDFLRLLDSAGILGASSRFHLAHDASSLLPCDSAPLEASS
jgi:hypothetical protein